ncbi:MAG: hypothetical protein KAR57_08130 [Bacteroidales bacterium]|nr:hypothetical protein [Bacteroidales bacterium]
MKNFLTVLSGIAFIMLMTLAVNAQNPKKKTTETKAKTEQCSKTVKCSKEKSKHCPSSCDKKAETKKAEEKKK